MPHNRIDPRRIKINFTYSVEEISRTLRVHKNTVRNWIKQKLQTVDARRPTLVHGRDLRAFLEERRRAARCQCPPGTIYCLKCRQPRRPALGMVEFVPHTPTTGSLRALCERCETIMYRRTRAESIELVMPDLAIQIRRSELPLTDRAWAFVNCDSGTGGGLHDDAQRK
jgi:hypothetical protein